MTPSFENGEIVGTCEPDIYFDDPPEPEPGLDGNAMSALLCVVFQLGQWATRDPIRVYAANVVMRQATQSTTNFAREHRVSASYVRRMIREARAVIGSAL